MKLITQLNIDAPGTEAWTESADGPRGGDFIVRHETLDDITMVLCDAAGHGSAAVQIADFTRSIIEREVRYGLCESLLHRWHSEVYRKFANDPRFVCMTALRLNYTSRLLTVVNAGNPDLLVRRGTGTEIERFGSTGMPLGIVEPEEWSAPKFVQTYLGNSDYALAFSDGVIDRIGKRGSRFGMERVLETLRWTTGALSPIYALRRGLMRFSSTTEEQDDVSMLVLRGRQRHVA